MGCSNVEKANQPTTRPSASIPCTIIQSHQTQTNVYAEPEPFEVQEMLQSFGSLANIFELDISSKIQPEPPKEEIKFKENIETTAEKEQYKYTCPICFRYFETMIQCVTCQNYTCMLCAEGLANRSVKTRTTTCCPFCYASPFVLSGVDINQPVRHYTNTPKSRIESRPKLPIAYKITQMPKKVEGEPLKLLSQDLIREEQKIQKRKRKSKIRQVESPKSEAEIEESGHTSMSRKSNGRKFSMKKPYNDPMSP